MKDPERENDTPDVYVCDSKFRNGSVREIKARNNKSNNNN